MEELKKHILTALKENESKLESSDGFLLQRSRNLLAPQA